MSKLIQCKACSNDIAMDARTCPKCGKVNEYLHPEIERFLKSKDSIEYPAAMRFQYQANVISFGIYNRSFWKPHKNLGRAGAVAVVFALLGVIKWRSFAYSLVALEVFFHVTAALALIYFSAGFVIFSLKHLIDAQSGRFGETPDQYLKIDFSDSQPKLECNRPDLFQPVLKFFNLEQRKVA